MLKNRVQGNKIELFDVPVACLRSGVGTIYVPLNVGDIVLVLFSKYELDEQLKDRQVVDVNQVLKFDLNNAVVLGGVFTQADGIPSIQEDKINLIGDVHVSGDLTFNTIDGTPIEDGSWHNP